MTAPASLVQHAADPVLSDLVARLAVLAESGAVADGCHFELTVHEGRVVGIRYGSA